MTNCKVKLNEKYEIFYFIKGINIFHPILFELNSSIGEYNGKYIIFPGDFNEKQKNFKEYIEENRNIPFSWINFGWDHECVIYLNPCSIHEISYTSLMDIIDPMIVVILLLFHYRIQIIEIQVFHNEELIANYGSRPADNEIYSPYHYPVCSNLFRLEWSISQILPKLIENKGDLIHIRSFINGHRQKLWENQVSLLWVSFEGVINRYFRKLGISNLISQEKFNMFCEKVESILISNLPKELSAELFNNVQFFGNLRKSIKECVYKKKILKKLDLDVDKILEPIRSELNKIKQTDLLAEFVTVENARKRIRSNLLNYPNIIDLAKEFCKRMGYNLDENDEKIIKLIYKARSLNFHQGFWGKDLINELNLTSEQEMLDSIQKFKYLWEKTVLVLFGLKELRVIPIGQWNGLLDGMQQSSIENIMNRYETNTYMYRLLLTRSCNLLKLMEKERKGRLYLKSLDFSPIKVTLFYNESIKYSDIYSLMVKVGFEGILPSSKEDYVIFDVENTKIKLSSISMLQTSPKSNDNICFYGLGFHCWEIIFNNS